MENKKIVESYVLSAMDIEENFAHGVYLDYMARKNWPAGIDGETFKEILFLLQILINDTERHKKTLLEMKKKLSRL